MSDELVIDHCVPSEGPTYTLYRDGHLLMAWGDEFHKALINHPYIKDAYDKQKEIMGHD